MAAGYVFGRLYTLDAATRRRALIRLGERLVALFIVLRATNLYGDPSKWSVQPNGVGFTVLSFLNTTKYPPSLLYLCMTIGPAILLLAFMERDRRGAIGTACDVRARADAVLPAAVGCTRTASRHRLRTRWGRTPTRCSTSCTTTHPRRSRTPASRCRWCTLFWILGVLLLYPICARYAAVKRDGTSGGWGTCRSDHHSQ